MKNRIHHTITYRLLSLLIVLTMLSGHIVPLSYATDGESAGQGLLAPVDETQPAEDIPAEVPAVEAPKDLLPIDTVMPAAEPEQPQLPAAPQSTSEIEQSAIKDAAPSGRSSLICKLAEHTHTESLCYQPVLICGMEENEIHEHGEGCTQEVKTLTCTLAEIPAHIHTEACNGQIEKFICGQEEVAAHIHSAENGCFTPKTTVICGQKEIAPHTHTDVCKGTEKKLTCSLKEEEAHAHSAECKGTERKLTCSLKETEGHTHGAECKGTENKLTCSLKETEGHTHTDACKGEPQLTCTLPEDEVHTHGVDCYAEASYACGKQEESAHTHGDGCYIVTEVNVCGKQEEPAHAHGEGCYTTFEINTCGKLETVGHAHGETCYTINEIYTCGLEETAGHSHTPECYKTEDELTCKLIETAGHTHTEACKIYETGLICKQEATEGHAHSDVCYTKTVNTLCTLATGVPHVHTESCYAPQKALICTLTAHTHGGSCYAAWKGQDLVSRYVTVSGNLPQGVTLKVSSVSIPNLRDLKQMALDILQGKLTPLFTYDISLQLNGEPYHLEEDVDVTVAISLPSLPSWVDTAILARITDYMTLYHVHDNGNVEEIGFNLVDNTVVFSVDSFSVFIGTINNGATVELTAGEGYKFYDINDAVLSGAVEWVDATTIIVKPELGYVIKSVTVNGGHGAAQVTENAGIYTLSFPADPTENQIITVEAEPIGSEVVFDLAKGDIVLNDDTYSGYSKNGVLLEGVHLPTNRYIIMQTDGKTTYTDHTVNIGTPTVGGGVETDFVIELQGINTRDTVAQKEQTVGNAVFYVHNQAPSTVVVILADGYENVLYAGTCHAGLEKGGGANGDGTLVITCEDGYRAWQEDHDTGHESCNASCGSLDARSGNAWAANNVYQTYIAGAGIGTTGAGNAAKTNNLDCSGITFSSSAASATGNASTAVDNSLRNLTIAGGNIAAYGARGNSNYSGGGAGIGTGSTCTSSTSYSGGTIRGLKITGGNIEAYRGDYSAACIGGGYRTGDVYIDIYGGTIVAEGVHPKATKPTATRGSVRGAGIGAGGGGTSTGSVGRAFVNISGGDIRAYSQFGAAIGGGGGGSSAGGKASTVTISGGTIVAITQGGAEQKDGSTVLGRGAGAAIGTGGSLGNGSGGVATVIISGGHITADSEYGADIGGGGTNSPSNGAGGEATVTITNGEIYALTGGIGGGLANTGNGGAAKVTISGGKIEAFSIGGGDSKTGNGGTADAIVNGPANLKLQTGIGGGQVTDATGGNGGDAIVKISDGVIQSGSVGGGTTASTTGGRIGSAQITISGGVTSAQFIMAAGAEDPCSFTMTAGELHPPMAGYTQVQPDGAAVWMDDPMGVATMSGGTISDCTAVNGGAIYMTAGTFTLSGSGTISGNHATGNGGAVYLGGGTMNISGGSIENNDSDHDGGAVYLGGGTMNIDGGTIANNTSEIYGGAVYMGGGTMNISGGEISDNSANNNGGGIYLSGGELNISGGAISGNKATDNGGGAYVANGSIYMSGGQVTNNTAQNGDGGGMYVSAESTDVSVMIFSGEIKNNRAAGVGGAVAVFGEQQADNSITVQTGVNHAHFDANGIFQSFQHTETKVSGEQCTYDHTACPIITANTTGSEGGAIYITGSTDTALNIYCLEEANNTVDTNGDQLSHFLMVDGGKVRIDTGDQTGEKGSVDITGTVHVTGGQVDLYGIMTNPGFSSSISVDITGKNDYFKDHRPNDGTFYKLQYFENFTDPETGVPSGRYTAYQITAGGTEKIRPVMYAHPGYEISGWNTKADGSGKKYEVGEEITFGDGAHGDLQLYAIWAPNVYTVVYDPNVPHGEKVYGNMEDQMISFDQTVKLTPNEYTYPGHRFVKWTTKDGTGRSYDDNASVTNLCQRNGDKIILYAQWEVCDHNPTDCDFTYEVDGDTLVRTCECLAQVVEVTIDADDYVYTWDKLNGKAVKRPAEVDLIVVTGELHTNDPWYDDDPEISYKVQTGPSTWENSGVPANAGNYRASVTAGEETIMVEYTIEKAPQDAPVLSKPFVVEGSATMTMTDSGTSKEAEDGPNSAIKIQYQLFWYSGGSLNYLDPQDGCQFTLPDSYTSYYVKAWYTEGTNHKQSRDVDSFSLFYIGETEIQFIIEDGILCERYNVTDSGDVDGMRILVEAAEGYYLTGEFSITAKDLENDVSYDQYIGTKTDKKEYLLNGVPNEDDLVITVIISGAKKLTGVTANVTEKKVFNKVTGSSADISRDSAFTVAYQITGYDATAYDNLSLQFAALPESTTILMLDKSNVERTTYWYYEKGAGTDTAVSLTSFTRMGTANEMFPEPASGDLNYQFIVDYSRVTSSWSDETAGIVLTATPLLGAPPFAKQTADGPGLYLPPSVTLHSARAFIVETVDEAQRELEQSVELTYGKSDGVTSKWDGRATALVLTQTSGAALPADTVLRVTDTGGSITWSASRSSDGQLCFIIPLGTVQSDAFTLKLESGMFPTTAENYVFEAKWYISESSSDGAPMNGEDVNASTSLSFKKAAESTPSVKLSTDGNVRVFESGSTMTINIAKTVPSTHTATAKLLFKTTTGGYSATAWERNLTADQNQITVPLDTAYGAGSFCLMVTVMHGTEIVMEVPYYFIIEALS